MTDTEGIVYAHPNMQLRVRPPEHDCLRAEWSGDMGIHSLQGRDPLAEALGSDVYSRRVLLDLGRVDRVDTFGVGWLIDCHKRFVQGGGRFVLHSATPLVGQMLGLFQLDRVLRIEPDLAAARTRAQDGSGTEKGAIP